MTHSEPLVRRSISFLIESDPFARQGLLSSCPMCGYDLSGSRESGRCPECNFRFKPDALCFVCEGYSFRYNLLVAATAVILVWGLGAIIARRFAFIGFPLFALSANALCMVLLPLFRRRQKSCFITLDPAGLTCRTLQGEETTNSWNDVTEIK